MALNEQQSADVKWALAAFNASYSVGSVSGTAIGRAALLQTYADYYNGDHPLLFATTKFLETFGTTFRANTENLCKLPVDILADLLQVEGFAPRTGTGGDNAISQATQEIWRRNRMSERAGQVHKNTPLFGESFVIVWPDAENEPVIYPNLPGNVVVGYHPEQLGYIVQAAKYWVEGARARLTIYTPELITRYATRNKAFQMPTGPGSFELYETDEVPAEQINPYGKVPVFRFVNNSGVGSSGESELRDIIPPQDRLNKALCDMLLSSEYAAYPQRYALGYDIRLDENGKPINPFQSGADRMWINENADGSFGQLATGDLTQYLKMIDDARMAIVRISGIPAHYLAFVSGGYPSGESLKVASERLTRKALDRQQSFGNTWADAMRFCLQIKGMADVELETLWTDPTPRLSELESWQAAQAEQAAGGSKDKTLRDRGYSQEQIEQAEQDRRAAMFDEGVPRSADDEEEAA